MSTIEYKILEEIRQLFYRDLDREQSELQFKRLVLDGLTYLMARNYVMGTSDSSWYRQWQTEVYGLVEQLKGDKNEGASD